MDGNDNNVLGIVLTSFLTPLVIALVAYLIKRKNQKSPITDTSHYVILQTGIYRILGYICVIFFGFCFVMSSISFISKGDYISFALIGSIFLLISLLGLLLLASSYIYKLKVNGDRFTYKELFRKEISIIISDITSYKIFQQGYGIETLRLYIGKKRIITVDSYQHGYDLFRNQIIAAGIQVKRK